MTKIYLIRHAEAEGNLYRIAHGQEEGLITDYRGPRQMQALARRFMSPRACPCTWSPPSGRCTWACGRA